jgi:HPt (histidine-containing phosphotransfer) domain-containing protein
MPEPAVDTDVLDQLALLGDDLVGELVELFARTAVADRAALYAAVEAGDVTAFALSAHRLRGGSANLGATRLTALCADLDERCTDGDVVPARTEVDTLAAELDLVWSALSAYVVAR